MKLDTRINTIIKNTRRPDTATIRSIDGNTVDITIGSSPNLIRAVQVVGSTAGLVPERSFNHLD